MTENETQEALQASEEEEQRKGFVADMFILCQILTMPLACATVVLLSMYLLFWLFGLFYLILLNSSSHGPNNNDLSYVWGDLPHISIEVVIAVLMSLLVVLSYRAFEKRDFSWFKWQALLIGLELLNIIIVIKLMAGSLWK